MWPDVGECSLTKTRQAKHGKTKQTVQSRKNKARIKLTQALKMIAKAKRD
jgi:hypothetical protein